MFPRFRILILLDIKKTSLWFTKEANHGRIYMNWGMIRESSMLAALSVGAEGEVFMWEEIGSFPRWLDAMNCVILDALPPPYRHGKEVCQGCYYRFCSPSWRV